jgi:hypothetical protein
MRAPEREMFAITPLLFCLTPAQRHSKLASTRPESRLLLGDLAMSEKPIGYPVGGP